MLNLCEIQKNQYAFQVDRDSFLKNWIDSVDFHKDVIKSEKKEDGELWIYVDVNN